MPTIKLSQICDSLHEDYYRVGNSSDLCIDRLSNPYDANEHSLIFISSNRADKQVMFEQTKANVIICDDSIRYEHNTDKCLIVVKNPKLTFAKLHQKFFSTPFKFEIHPTAIIHPEAELANDIYIGPHSYLGKCKIESNTFIYGNCYIYDNVIIGNNVTIQAGAIIGAPGCGHIQDSDGIYYQFPHIGRVIIESNVQIGTNSCIAKGALTDTVIKNGVIIDSFVQVGHNALIEENVLILANVVVSGSCVIKKQSFLAIGASICDYVTIGENAHIGPGVVVMSDVKNNSKLVTRAPMTIS